MSVINGEEASVPVIDTLYDNIYSSVNKDKEEFEITSSELENLKKALKDETFRKMLSDYVEEVRDPQNQITFQSELRELERERGNTVHFINPIAAYVLKTSINGEMKGFINICSNKLIRKPQFEQTVQNNKKGSLWSIPYSQSTGREDYDKNGQKCMVYDVIYNPEAIFLAQRNPNLKEKLEQTALDAVEQSFDIKLDRINVKKPKLKYKGLRNAVTIKYKTGDNPPYIIDSDQITNEPPPEKDDIQNNVQKETPTSKNQSDKKIEAPTPAKKDENKAKKKSEFADWTVPKYSIKYRSHIDMQNYSVLLQKSTSSTVPDEMILTVDLPMLKNSKGLDADVICDGSAFELSSDLKALYHLKINLPHKVHPESSKASFDKDKRKLVVTMKIKKQTFSTAQETQIEKTNTCTLVEEMN